MISRPVQCETLNDAQRAALDLERDLLVDAGAGAGKTLVLALRVLALLEHGHARISEIVAFTFTEKAAAEMRARVQDLLLRRIAQLEQEAEKDAQAGEHLKLLRAARGEFSQCRITTVHGFCHRLLAEHAWEAGLEPGAPMLQEREQPLARQAAISKVLTRTSENAEPECAAALARLAAITRLGALFDTLDRMLRERHEMQPALARALANWGDSAAEVERRRKAHADLLDAAFAPCLEVLRTLPLGALSVIPADDKLRATLESVGAALQGWPGGDSARQLQRVLLTGKLEARSFTSMGTRKNWAKSLAQMEQCKERLASAASLLEEHGANLLGFTFDAAHELRSGAALRDLATVFARVLASYEEERAGKLDFLELELGTLKLLRGSADVREEVCRRIRFLLIDEFQDTNPTQSALFSLLIESSHTPGRLFAVGDAKQSIYGFRGADVGVFNDARHSIPARNEASGSTGRQRLVWRLKCEDSPERKRGLIVLDTNYRTVPRLLETGNALLEHVLKRPRYERFDAMPKALKAGRNLENSERQAERPLELHFLPGARDEEAGAEDEPELLAQRVETLLAEGFKLSEIAILVRTRARNAEIARAFARRRLPLIAMGEGGLLQTQEALDCISILRALANPGDDIALLGWLRSPFGGLSDEALTTLAPAKHGHTPPLFKRLGEARFAAADDAAARARFLENFGMLAARVGREAPSSLLACALENAGAYVAVSCGAQAEQRTANLQRMLEVVRELEPRFASLASLARELARRVEDEEDEAQGEPEQGGEFVRLMTIHGAKGLEFKVVIVPEIGNRKSGGDNGWLRALPAGDAPLGLHIPWLGDDDDRGRLSPDFEAWRAELQAAEREGAEYRRLFYVAFTRARDRLILTGAVPEELRQGARATWADMLLGALGCAGFGQSARELEGLALKWWHKIERSQARALQPDVQRVEAAQAQGSIELARAIDDTLAAPLPRAQEISGAAPDAVEFGTLVHAELERRILARNRGAKLVQRDGDVGQHATNAEIALGRLRRALEVPEWRVFDGDSERRIDLLRSADDEFEIVDFKTDAVTGDPEAYARERHSEQLRQYAGLLRKQLAARRLKPKKLRLLVCFTAPGIPDHKRLVEIAE